MVEFNFNESTNSLICSFYGRLDTVHSHNIKKQIEEKIGECLRNDPNKSLAVIFDIAKVDYIASAFIRICMQSVKMIGKDNFSNIRKMFLNIDIFF